MSTHESLTDRSEVKVGSKRSFGLVFAVVFLIVGLFPLLSDNPIRLWALGVAGLFLAFALCVPKALRPLNLVWFKFGLLLHKVMNPVIMGLMFFIVITPMAVTMRLFGAKLLGLTFDRKAKSYWIERDPPGPTPESMKNQF